MSILVSETGQGNTPGGWSCCLHCYSIIAVPGMVFALKSAPASNGPLSTAWEKQEPEVFPTGWLLVATPL